MHPRSARRRRLLAGRVFGIGATKAVFAAHHQADTDSKLVPGCCFLPTERDGSDHIGPVLYANGRVFHYEIHYAPTVPLRVAQTELARELPSDATLRFSVRKPECQELQYGSALLRRIDGPVKETAKSKKLDALLGREVPGLVDVNLYSSETGTYNGSTVESIILSRGYNAGDKTTGC